MEQPAEPSGDSAAADFRARQLLNLPLERALRIVADEERFASGDLWIYAHYATRLLTRLREVAPDLLEAVEIELEFGVQKP